MAIKHITFLILLLIPFCGFTKEQYQFTPLEIEMDELANAYSSERSVILEKMNEFIKKNGRASIAEKSLFLTYDCSLRANLTPELAQETLAQLENYSVQHSRNYSVRAATALCKANLFIAQKKTEEYELEMRKAFLFVENSRLATLRYWIGIGANDHYQKVGDYRTAERSLTMALEVSRDNNDYFRLASTHQMLSELHYKMGRYSLAIQHSDKSKTFYDKSDSKLYLLELLMIRADIYLALKNYSDAERYYLKAIKQSQLDQLHRYVKFFELDLAYVATLKGEQDKSLAFIEKVERYANDYNDDFLASSTQLIKSYYLQSINKTEQSEKLFSNAIKYFVMNNFQEEVIKAWQNLAVVSENNGQYALATNAREQHNVLSNDRIITQNNQSLSHFITANRLIWSDDASIADKRVSQVEVKLSKAKYQAEFYLTVLTVSGVLAFIALIKIIRGWLIRRKNALEQLNRKLYIDPLTSAYNRRYFDDVFTPLLTSDKGNVLGELFILDIDHFKAFNDTFGHAVGDDVLKEVVRRLQNEFRYSDKIIRTGGEEFVIFIPLKEELRVDIVAQRLLKIINETPIIIDNSPQTITVSLGYISAANLRNKNDLNGLINLADKALYIAKQRGRNRAVGITNLQCSVESITDIELAQENGLLDIREVSGS